MNGMEQSFRDVVLSHKDQYQHYLSQLLERADLEPYERWIDGLPEQEKGEFNANAERVIAILSEAERAELNVDWLYVLFLQYVLADRFLRELYKNNWIETVAERKDTDFFPDCHGVVALLSQQGYFDEVPKK